MTYKYGSSFVEADPASGNNVLGCVLDVQNPKSYPGSGTDVKNLGTQLAYSSGDTIKGVLGGEMTVPTNPLRFKTNTVNSASNDDYNINLVDALDDGAESFHFADQAAWSQEMVAKIVSGQTSYHSLTGRSATTPWWNLYVSSDTNWIMRYRISGGDYKDSTTQTTDLSEWHHLTITCATDRTLSFYVNGQLTNSVDGVNTYCQVSRVGGGYICCSGAAYHNLRGEFLYYRLYNKTLTANEVNQNYGAALGRMI